jgi:dTMP kinase
LYVYFDVDPAIGLARKSDQGPEELNHFEARELEFHKRQREGCKEFMEKVPHKIIDASRSIDGVWEEFQKVLVQEIGSE